MLRSQRGKGGERIAAGLLVDALDGVCTLDGAGLKPPPPTLSAETAAYLLGVGTLGDPPRPLPILSPEKIVACPALAPFARPRSP
jgi:chemotaxis signal transduction protein